MVFVNTRAKFYDNRLRNEFCKAVTPFQGGGGQKPPIWGGGGLYVTCDAHFQTRIRDDVREYMCEVLQQSVKK